MPFRKKSFLTLIALLFPAAVFCHDCFLIAKPFRTTPGKNVKIEIHIDERFPGKSVVWNPERIARYHHWYGRTLLDSVIPDPINDSSGVVVPVEQSGLHLFVVDRRANFIELEAKKFNQYLRSEGLENILTLRKQRNEENKAGREKYSRYIKTLVSTGEGDHSSYHLTIGQTFEIIPLDNPYFTKPGDTLRVRVVFQGKAIAGKKISATYAGASSKPDSYELSTRTNREGVAAFRLTHAGAWLVRSVFMRPSESPEADWESFWASLTFDVR